MKKWGFSLLFTIYLNVISVTVPSIVDTNVYRFSDVLPLINDGTDIAYFLSDQSSIGSGFNSFKVVPMLNGVELEDYVYSASINKAGVFDLEVSALGLEGIDYNGLKIYSEKPLNKAIESQDPNLLKTWSTSLKLRKNKALDLIHSAEKNWDTIAYVMNESNSNVNVEVKFIPKSGETFTEDEQALIDNPIEGSITPYGTAMIDLENYLPRTMFGKIARWEIKEIAGSTPFDNPKNSLKGIQTYSKLDYSTASDLELIAANKLFTGDEATRKLYFSHIAEDGDWWYTGGAILNHNSEVANITYTALDINGNIISSKTHTVDPNSKHVDLVRNLVGATEENMDNISHVYVTSDIAVKGGLTVFGHPDEEVKKEQSGLVALTQKNAGYVVEVAHTELSAEKWCGFAALNISDRDMLVRADVFNYAGDIVGSKVYSVNANSKLLGVVEDIVEFEEGEGPLDVQKIRVSEVTEGLDKTINNPGLVAFDINGFDSFDRSGAIEGQSLDALIHEAGTLRRSYNYGETANLKIDLETQKGYKITKVEVSYGGGEGVDALIENVNSSIYENTIEFEVNDQLFVEQEVYTPKMRVHMKNDETGDETYQDRTAEAFVAGTTSPYKLTLKTEVITSSGLVGHSQGEIYDIDVIARLYDIPYYELEDHLGQTTLTNVAEPDSVQRVINTLNSSLTDAQFQQVTGELRQTLSQFFDDSDLDDYACDGPENLFVGNGVPEINGHTGSFKLILEKNYQ